MDVHFVLGLNWPRTEVTKYQSGCRPSLNYTWIRPRFTYVPTEKFTHSFSQTKLSSKCAMYYKPSNTPIVSYISISAVNHISDSHHNVAYDQEIITLSHHATNLQSCRRLAVAAWEACQKDALVGRCYRGHPWSSYHCIPFCLPSSPSTPWTMASWEIPQACCHHASLRSAQMARCPGCNRSSWCKQTLPSGFHCSEPDNSLAINIPFYTLESIFPTKHPPAFSTNHMVDTDKTKHILQPLTT